MGVGPIAHLHRQPWAQSHGSSADITKPRRGPSGHSCALGAALGSVVLCLLCSLQSGDPPDIPVTPKPPSTAESWGRSTEPGVPSSSPWCCGLSAACCRGHPSPLHPCVGAGAPGANAALRKASPPLRARGSPDLFLIRGGAPRRGPSAPAPWAPQPRALPAALQPQGRESNTQPGKWAPQTQQQSHERRTHLHPKPHPLSRIPPFPSFWQRGGECPTALSRTPYLSEQSRAGQFVDSGQSTRTAKPGQSAVSGESCWPPRRGSSTSLFLSEKCNHFLTWALGERRAALQPPCPRVLPAAGLPSAGKHQRSGAHPWGSTASVAVGPRCARSRAGMPAGSASRWAHAHPVRPSFFLLLHSHLVCIPFPAEAQLLIVKRREGFGFTALQWAGRSHAEKDASPPRTDRSSAHGGHGTVGFPAAGGLGLSLWVSVALPGSKSPQRPVGSSENTAWVSPGLSCPWRRKPVLLSPGVADQSSSQPDSIPRLLSLRFLRGKVPPTPTAALRVLGGLWERLEMNHHCTAVGAISHQTVLEVHSSPPPAHSADLSCYALSGGCLYSHCSVLLWHQSPAWFWSDCWCTRFPQ